MTTPNFNLIGETLKTLGDQISKFSEIPALKIRQHGELLQNEDIVDGEEIPARETLAEPDYSMAMELEEW